MTAFSFDRHGNRIWREAQALLDSEHARYAVGEIAVPYGRCTEPSNVQASGGACPLRFRCAGCDHFRTDVAFLPDLTGYLDDLLRTRERLAAAVEGVDEWARADATPTEEEITRIRRLINRIKGDIDGLDETERAQIDDALTVVRRHRAAHTVALGMPALRAPRPAPPDHDHRGGHRMTTTTTTEHTHHLTAPSTRTQAMVDGRHAESARRRQRVITALDRARATATEISVSAIARAAGVDRSFLYRHHDLLTKIHAAEAQPPTTGDGTGPAVTRASLQADLPAAHERATRLHARIQHLEKRLSDALGEHAWRESGLGAPTDIDALHQRITHLEQQTADLELQLAERDEDLTAARATNRELMARINAPIPNR